MERTQMGVPLREGFMEGQPLEADADVTALPHGTKVGVWRLKGCRGRGTYGTVYRAVWEGDEQGREVALKLAIHPRDARFKREAELLRRGRHPSVPQLLDAGEWQHPNGFIYPFIVMSWVEGEGLYEWAARRNPSSRQVMRLLAQAAGALQTTHEAGGVHRDVKGGNVLVRPADGRLFLMDFGAGNYKGAERLTSSPLPPGTPAYRSPEAWAFDLHQRMLSPQPEERGTARELAEAMERASAQEGPVTDAPLFEWETLKRTEWPQEDLAAVEELGHRARRRDREVVRVAADADAARRAEAERQQVKALTQPAPRVERDVPRERNWPGRLWLAAVMMLGALVLWPRERGLGSTEEEFAATQEATAEEKRDGGVTYVGDTALTSPHSFTQVPSGKGVALEVPPKPLPGQLKPDANGRCRKGQYAINGGCWLKVEVSDLEDCKGIRNGFEFKGGCYTPIFPLTREPTSAPLKGTRSER